MNHLQQYLLFVNINNSTTHNPLQCNNMNWKSILQLNSALQKKSIEMVKFCIANKSAQQ